MKCERPIIFFFILFLCFLQISAIHADATGFKDNKDIRKDLEMAKQELQSLNFNSIPPLSQSTYRYFRYYGLNFEGSKHIFGTFTSGKKILAAHIFKPEKIKGTVLLLHGYLDHTGILKHIIKNLLKQGYSVALYDQPGHGLSSGDRASIDDFSEYVIVFKDFLQICRTNLTDPFHLVAHSMGCTAIIDYLLTADSRPLDKIVFIAPLFHSAFWKLSIMGQAITKAVSDSVPRIFRNNSSDKDFIHFVKNDPLQARSVPLKWFDALAEWNDRLISYKPSKIPIKIIQGAADTTVDWEYNINLLKKIFPNADITMIPYGRHQLLNESPSLRIQVMALINQYLGIKRQHQ